MKQVGYKNLVFLSLIFLLFSSNIFAAANEKVTDNISKNTVSQLSLAPATPPVFYDTFYVCPGESIYDTVYYNCNNVVNPPVEFTLLDGPGNFSTWVVPSEDTIYGAYSYIPQNEGDIQVTYLIVDENKDTLFYFYSYTVYFNDVVPVIEDQYFSSVACDLTSMRELQVVATDTTQAQLTFELLQGLGSIDPYTGLLSYRPDTSGVFQFLVSVSNGCGADTALVVDSVHLNTPPQVFCYDSLVTLCNVEEICFDVFGFDVDSDPVELIMLEGIGNFSMTSDSSGKACFIPADVDSAVYRFIFRGADSCTIGGNNGFAADDNGGECCRDTSLITVVINRPPVLTCPEPQYLFLCDTTEFCIDLNAFDYENSDLTYNLLSGDAVITDSTVCVTATTSGTFEYVVEVVDECGFADTCTIPVTVEMNSGPIVNSANDFSMNLCTPETICFNATVDDVNGNIANIFVNNGTYNQSTNQVCFTPDTSGVYAIMITATDSCGLVDSSTTLVTVHLNDSPTINLGIDYALEICADQQICIEPNIIDENLDRVLTNFSFYNEQTGAICFAPDTSGTYQIIAEAVDDCGSKAVDTINIDVTVIEKPTLSIGDTLNVSMCAPEQICVDVVSNSDLSGLQYNFGQLNSETSQICFTPDSAGIYTLEVTLTDSCGFDVTAYKTINVDFKSAPVVSSMSDTTVYICQPTSICLPVSITDADNDIVSITTNRGSYADGAVCFVPYDSGSYKIIVTATDSCGNVTSDTALVHVLTDQAVNVIVPNDTLFFTCQLDTFCFPVSGIPAGAEVSVTGINTWYDAENSTICYFAECSNKNKITLSVATACNTFTKSFNVTVNCNTEPLVILPQDTTIFLCELAPISLPLGVTDVDGNLIDVTVEGGTYNNILHLLTFTPDTAGTYKLSVTATDSCEATDYDEIYVTVLVNSAPECNIPEDGYYSFCEPTQLSLPVYAYDADSNNVLCEIISGPGQIVDGNWIYNVVGNDSLTVTIRCSDDCGAFCEKSFTLFIHMNNAPEWSGESTFTFNQCDPTEVFIPFTALDPDFDNIDFTLLDQIGTLVDSGWIYTPTVNGVVEFTAQASDSCGAFTNKLFTVNFNVNRAPFINCPREQTFFGCAIDTLCFNVSASDPDGDSLTYTILSDNATIDGQTICMTNLVAGEQQVVVEVTDTCGHADTCSVPVSIDLNLPPEIVIVKNTFIQVCKNEPACLDILISDPEGADVTTYLSNGAFIQDGRVCFLPDSTGTYVLVINASDDCKNTVIDSTIVNVTVTTPPIVDAGEDFSTALCEPGEVCLDVNIIGDNIDFTSIPGGYYNWELQQYCFMADTSGSYDIVVSATDSCGYQVSDTVNVAVTISDKPSISLGDDLQFKECSLSEICIDINTDNQIVSANVNTPAVFNSETSQICFTPDTTGIYTFIVEAIDTCGLSAFDTINVTVDYNERPVITDTRDSTVYLCNVEDICFDITASDVEGDPLVISQYLGIGKFTQLDDSTGQTCFTPENVDSATYTFVYCVTDSCGDGAGNITPPICSDTVNITVIINKAPEIVCPTEQRFFTCAVDTFCFDIDATDFESGQMTFNILSQNATVNNNTVCVVGGESDSFNVVIEVVDDCGKADTCSVPVVFENNREPIVMTAGDFASQLCEPELICFGVTIDDLDFNLSDITVNFGTYDSQNDQICFAPDTSGVYTIITTATDSCGAVGVDTTVVTVDINQAPIVDAGEDFAVSLCAPGQVCFDVTITDNNRAYTSIPGGFYNWSTEQYCFNADTSGVYAIEVSATDSCGLRTSDIVNVTVTINEGPFVDLGDDLDLFVCDLGEYCIDVSTVANYDSIVVTGDAVYNPETHQLCANLTEDGTYFMAVEVFDTCGLSAYDEIYVNISSNNPPQISHMPDTTVYICNPTAICLPFDVQDGNIASISVNRGSYSDGQICFVPYDSGTYQIIATVIDSCGLTVKDTAQVRVVTDQGIKITGQADTTIFVCELDTLCFPIYGIPEGSAVTVSGINTWYNAETSEVCYYAECSSNNKIKVTATTACGSYSYSFNVTIVCNTPPLVILPQDTTLTVCGPQDICLPIGITDINKNLGSVSVIGGTYGPILSRFCFTADTAGTYIIGVTAEDTCGASDFDDVVVTVVFNTAPIITAQVLDSAYLSCGASEICVPMEVTDANNNLQVVNTSFGTYFNDTHLFCFVPDTSGLYCVEIEATDVCGLTTIDTICIQAEVGGYVEFECPTVLVADSICGADSVCVPLTIGGEVNSVTTSLGIFENGQLCFFADTTGLYTVSLTATADCNEVTCEFTVEVNNKVDVTLQCPGDVDTLLCGTDTLYFDYTTSSSVTSVIVSSPAYILNNQVVLPIATAGSYTIQMSASGDCGIDTCSFTVNATFNTAPTVTSIDTTLTVCSIDSICVPFNVLDVDSNVVDITTSIGTVNGNTVCVLPIAYGQTSIVITATDACGLKGTYVANINLIQGGTAVIECPEDQFATLCGPDSVCISVPITPIDADVTILDNGNPANAKYNFETGNLCLFVESAGVHDITIIADALCADDTCNFQVTTTISQPPAISSPASIDTTMCLAEATSLCFDVQSSGTGLQVSVTPSGTFSAGVVCVDVDTAGTYEVEIIASNNCGADTSYTTLHVTANTPPVLNLPQTQTIEWCPQDTNTICIAGIKALDAVQITSFNMVCGDGSFTKIFSDTGFVCFVPDSIGLYSFCFEASDGCSIVSDTFFVDVVQREDCDVCVRVSIDGGEQVPVGVQHDVLLNIESSTFIGGFDILVTYDASVMTFNTATIVGTAIDGWEYFTYRLGSEGCGANCPSGLLRLVGLADLNNGPSHPPAETLEPNGTLVKMNFLVANDQNLGDLFLPIEFVWYDCGDNSFSNTLGSILYLDSRIYNSENALMWDEEDNVLFPETSRPFGLGAVDQCLVGASSAPVRCVEFINGGIKVIHPDSIDARGDINLNSIAYEIGDAVLYSNYFIYGISVFTINLAGQIAASDVNADGLTLSVADLVLMIRIIVGDANPMPKLVPYSEELVIESIRSGSEITVHTDAVSEIGGMLLVYDLDESVNINGVKPTDAASDMQMMYDVVDNQLRILVYDMGRNSIASGENDVLDILYDGDGEIALTKAEVVDYQGRPYTIQSKLNQLPTGFALSQNYPNPFNPTTTIQLALPHASEWTLSIYNVNGHLVKRISGNSQAGILSIEWDGTSQSGSQVASGMYFYKAEAAEFSDTKKMILLK